MKKHAFTGIISVLLLLSGCASLPSPGEMREDVKSYQLPMLPVDGKAIVYVVRPSSMGTLVRFNVFVDDKQPESEMGYNRGGQYIYFNVAPGDHQILSKAENWAEVNVTAKGGDIIFIQQEASMGLIMARNSVFKLQAHEGKYHVKHLSLGTIIKTDKNSGISNTPPASTQSSYATHNDFDAGDAHLRDESSRLDKLKKMRDDGLITHEDYDKKKKEILDAM